MAKSVSKYSVGVTETATNTNTIFKIVRGDNGKVTLDWSGYAGPPGVFLITRRESRKRGLYETRGNTRSFQFQDTIPVGQWFKFRVVHIPD